MAFVQEDNNLGPVLIAYLTQKGREYLVSGQTDSFKAAYFALGDPDTNYNIAAQNVGADTFNILPANMVPDISGDHTGGVRSLAGNLSQRYFIKGGTNVGQLGSNGVVNASRSVISLPTAELTRPLAKTTPGAQRLLFTVPVTAFAPNGLTGNEQVKAFILPPSQGTSFSLYQYLSIPNPIITWAAVDPLTKQISLQVNSPAGSGSSAHIVKIGIIPYNSVLDIESRASVLTVILRITAVSNTGSGPVGNVASPY